jgi:hypothetical protein
MTLLRCACLLPFATTLALCQAPPQRQPETLVRSLYKEVVARHPSGIPSGNDWKVFAPYLSKVLLHRIDDFNACVADWDSRPQDPKYPVKAPFGIFESGMFSGGDERTAPRAFLIEGTKREKDGSVRVYVTLKWWETERPIDQWHISRAKPYVWHVAPVLIRERDRWLVDDVIYLKEETVSGGADWRLTQSLSYDCDGPRFAIHSQR